MNCFEGGPTARGVAIPALPLLLLLPPRPLLALVAAAG